jgi:hypothetical protein
LKSAIGYEIKDYYGNAQEEVSAIATGKAGDIYKYKIEMPEGTGSSKFRLEADSPYATIEFCDENGNYLANEATDKYIYNTITYPLGNVTEKTLKFRIVPSGVLYDTNSIKTSQYNPNDGCSYYILEVINTPQGTGLQSAYVQYDKSTGKATEAAHEGYLGFRTSVSKNLTTTTLKLVPESSDAVVKVEGYENQTTGAGTVIIEDFALEPEGISTATITVTSVSQIQSTYTLKIMRLVEGDYNMSVFIQKSIETELDLEKKLYTTDEKLPTYQSEAIVTALFTDPDSYEKGYRVVIGEESTTNKRKEITTADPSVTNSNVPLEGATTYVPIYIYQNDEATSPLAMYQVLIEKDSVDNILDSVYVEKRAPDEINTAADGERKFVANVYNKTRTATVEINAVDNRATIELVRLNNKDAQDQSWESMATGTLNAGVTELVDGANEFIFIVRPSNTQVYGAYYLTINYTDVDVSLDMLSVSDDKDEEIPFRGKEFKPNILDYELNLDKATSTYTFKANAQTSLKSIRDKGIEDDLKIYIGEYESLHDLQEAATVVTENCEPITREFNEDELELNDEGFAEVPVTLVLGDYTKEYTVMIHAKSSDADLSHTTVGLGVVGYELTPPYEYDQYDYELTVEANVNIAEIYAIANHIHKNSTTLLTLTRKIDSQGNVVKSALNNLDVSVALSPGVNEFIVTVESEDSKNTRTYNLTINKKQLELNIDTLTVDGVRAQRDGNEFFVYVTSDAAPTVLAQSDNPKYVTTQIISESGSVLGAMSDELTPATASNVVQTHLNADKETDLTIRLVDNTNEAHYQDYKLRLLNPANDDILSIVLGTGDGSFSNSNESGYDIPISAKWDEERDAYVASVPAAMADTTIRVTTVNEGKLVKIGSFSAQIYDYYDDTHRQFTAKDKVVVPNVLTIGVANLEENKDLNDYVYNEYTLIIEKMSDEANLYNADFILPTDPNGASPHADFTINLPTQLNHAYNVDNDVAYITFTGLKMSDKATGSYTLNARNSSTSGIFTEGESLKLDLNEGVNNIKIKVTSQDRTVSKTYSFNINRAINENISKLNDIKIQIGNTYYDTVAVPAADNTKNVLTYHLTIPQEIDETETPIIVTAVPFDDGLEYSITNKVVVNGDTSDSSTTSSKEVIIGDGSSKYNSKLDGGDTVRIIYNVKTDGKNASEYVVELFKDSNLDLDPQLAYLTNIMRADTERH